MRYILGCREGESPNRPAVNDASTSPTGAARWRGSLKTRRRATDLTGRVEIEREPSSGSSYYHCGAPAGRVYTGSRTRTQGREAGADSGRRTHRRVGRCDLLRRDSCALRKSVGLPHGRQDRRAHGGSREPCQARPAVVPTRSTQETLQVAAAGAEADAARGRVARRGWTLSVPSNCSPRTLPRKPSWTSSGWRLTRRKHNCVRHWRASS